MGPATLLSVLTLSSATLLAQSAPIKMGLWEKKMTMTYAGQPQTINSKSCVTLENWQKMVEQAQKQRPGCTQAMDKNAHGYTFTSSCNIGGAVLEVHGQLTIQDSEHIVSQTHSTTTRNGQKKEGESHSTMRLLSANCGTVKPDEPEVDN